MGYLGLVVLLAGLQNDPFEFRVKFHDGTVLLCSFDVKDLSVKTEFGSISIPLNQVQSIKSAGGEFIVKCGSTIRGKIDQKLNLKTKYGTLKVNMDGVAEVVPSDKKITFDENTLGFWSFEDKNELKITGGETANVNDKTVLKLDLSKGDYIEIPHKEEFNQKETLTLEIRFMLEKIDPVDNAIGLMVKGDSFQSGMDAWHIALWPQYKELRVGYYNVNGALVSKFASNLGVAAGVWYHMAVVIDAKNSRMDGYLNGTKVPFQKSGHIAAVNIKTNDSPIFICKDRRGHNDVILVDYVRISKKAKTDEEMKEGFESSSFTSQSRSSDREFDSVIITKSGERLLCKPEKDHVEIETLQGDIKVDLGKISMIQFFDYRREQIEKLSKQARELVQKLSDNDPQVRDKAQEELKGLGAVILPVLEENKDHQDEEVKTRVKKLIELLPKKFEIKKDTIVGSGIEIRGWVRGGGD